MHYPSSLTCSTVGGFLAHRGIGVVSTKYGKIDDMVLQMEVVLPNGDIINTSLTRYLSVQRVRSVLSQRHRYVFMSNPRCVDSVDSSLRI